VIGRRDPPARAQIREGLHARGGALCAGGLHPPPPPIFCSLSPRTSPLRIPALPLFPFFGWSYMKVACYSAPSHLVSLFAIPLTPPLVLRVIRRWLATAVTGRTPFTVASRRWHAQPTPRATRGCNA
jgi:hypothetical protein